MESILKGRLRNELRYNWARANDGDQELASRSMAAPVGEAQMISGEAWAGSGE
jgi:hypothetical protein